MAPDDADDDGEEFDVDDYNVDVTIDAAEGVDVAIDDDVERYATHNRQSSYCTAHIQGINLTKSIILVQ